MFGIEFYPTPPDLIEKMIVGLKITEAGTVLEPSAGKGDIADYISAKFKAQLSRYNKNQQIDIDTVEIDENLRHILKGKGYRVIHDDFLSLQTFKRYDLILMNPPFSDGDRHLLKALDMQSKGGKIICLLNSETLRNAYTNTRRDLIRKLEDHGASIEYVQHAFIGAERKTDIEIALIKVDIPPVKQKSIILDNLKREEDFQTSINSNNNLTSSDYLKRLVEEYNFEVRSGLSLIDEYYSVSPALLFLRVVDEDKSSDTKRNCYIKQVRSKHWNALFKSDSFTDLLTSNLRYEYLERIDDLANYDFSLYNIYQIKSDIFKQLAQSVEDTILSLFEELSHKHHWYNETSRNIHYYDGWKTNKAWIINKKVIIPLRGFNSWDGRIDYDYKVIEKLTDIEKVFNYLDGGRTDHVDLRKKLEEAKAKRITGKIVLKYFTVTFYKKGTCHIHFKDLDLLKKFNVFGSQKKGWLPPTYGKKKYQDMSAGEKEVINSFEGQSEYEKTMEQAEWFLFDASRPLMLGQAG